MMDDTLGTNWVAPGEGSRPSELYEAASRDGQLSIGLESDLRAMIADGDKPTNLKLTGRRIQNYDYDRMRSIIAGR
jgi:hypothetical protein